MAHLTPKRKDVRLHGAPGRTVVVKPSDATVNFERRDVEKPPLESIDESLSEGFPAPSGTAAVAGEGCLEAPSGGTCLDFQVVEGLDRSFDLRLRGTGSGLEVPDGVGLCVDGRLLLGQILPEGFLGGGHRQRDRSGKGGREWEKGFGAGSGYGNGGEEMGKEVHKE